jgi:hypothetical protein
MPMNHITQNSPFKNDFSTAKSNESFKFQEANRFESPFKNGY